MCSYWDLSEDGGETDSGRATMLYDLHKRPVVPAAAGNVQETEAIVARKARERLERVNETMHQDSLVSLPFKHITVQQDTESRC